MKENLSQSKLLEILTHEIEVLRKTSSNINEVAPIINQRLRELKQEKFVAHIDIRELETVLNTHKNFIKTKTTVPKWFLIVFIAITGILILQSIWLYAYFFGSNI